MPVTPGAVFAENLFFSITVNGSAFPYVVSGSIKGGVNSARTFTCSFRGREALEVCSLGSIVEVSVGRGTLTNLIDDKKVSQSLMSSQLEKFANPNEKMNYIINEGGGNVSIGEKIFS